jgi:lysyl-tRNA synthetase class 2
MSHPELSEQEILRRESLQKLRDLGIDPYPAALYPVDAFAADIKQNFEDGKQVCLAGRMLSQRIMGKASFAEIQDASGRIQVYFNRDELCPGEDKTLYNEVFKKLLDLGDFIGIKGHVFKTQVGEISVHVTEFMLLSKSLRPLPLPKTDAAGVVHDAFTDPELRYRQRYVDLVVNRQVKEVFIKRTKLFNAMRDFFNRAGYMEVETPVLQAIPGGASTTRSTFHFTCGLPMSSI